MRHALRLLSALALPAALFADVAPAAEREAAAKALLAARGRYEAVPSALRWERLVVDDRVYPRARVHSADTWSATIFYDHGVRNMPLAKLPEPARRLLGYDAGHPPAPPPKPVFAPVAPVPAAPVAKASGVVDAPVKVVWTGDPVSRVLMAYGERPVLHRAVDLRPEFDRHGLSAKDQGGSPSCSVFAVVSALEYHLAQGGRLPSRLSEDFVLWAVLRSLGKTRDRLELFGGEPRLSDGLTLIEVTQALRSYGAPLKSAMPGAFNPSVDTPPESAQREAWSRCMVGSVALSGRTRREQLEQMILALNEGLPVIIGMRWPADAPGFFQTGEITADMEETTGGHAVVVVGYSCPDGDISKSVFRFRNSYGSRWGDKGYGTVTWAYLEKNFSHGLFLDLR